MGKGEVEGGSLEEESSADGGGRNKNKEGGKEKKQEGGEKGKSEKEKASQRACKSRRTKRTGKSKWEWQKEKEIETRGEQSSVSHHSDSVVSVKYQKIVM